MPCIQTSCEEETGLSLPSRWAVRTNAVREESRPGIDPIADGDTTSPSPLRDRLRVRSASALRPQADGICLAAESRSNECGRLYRRAGETIHFATDRPDRSSCSERPLLPPLRSAPLRPSFRVEEIESPAGWPRSLLDTPRSDTNHMRSSRPVRVLRRESGPNEPYEPRSPTEPASRTGRRSSYRSRPPAARRADPGPGQAATPLPWCSSRPIPAPSPRRAGWARDANGAAVQKGDRFGSTTAHSGIRTGSTCTLGGCTVAFSTQRSIRPAGTCLDGRRADLPQKKRRKASAAAGSRVEERRGPSHEKRVSRA